MAIVRTIALAWSCLAFSTHMYRVTSNRIQVQGNVLSEHQHSRAPSGSSNGAAHKRAMESSTHHPPDRVTRAWLSLDNLNRTAHNQSVSSEALEIQNGLFNSSQHSEIVELKDLPKTDRAIKLFDIAHVLHTAKLYQSQSEVRLTVQTPLKALANLLLISRPAAAFGAFGLQGQQVTQVAILGVFGGACLVTISHFLRRSAEALLQELQMIKAMATAAVETAVKQAEARGVGKPVYTKLSGESWTGKPLESQGGPALVIKTETSEKIEAYEWTEGEPIFEERKVLVNGEYVQEKVDTGQRKEGKWVAKESSRKVEDNTKCASSGICFRQLGATSNRHAPLQICVDLRKFDVGGLLENQDAVTHFAPSEVHPVNVAMNNPNQQPPSRVLGHETVECFAPIGQEVFALGDVSLQHAASVRGIQAEGTVVALRPCPGKPFIFGFGSETSFLRQKENEIAGRMVVSRLLDAVGYSSICLSSIAGFVSFLVK